MARRPACAWPASTSALAARFAPNAGVGNWGRAATWWDTPGLGGGSPYGKDAGHGTDGAPVPGASGGGNEGNRYLAVIAEGIGTLVRNGMGGAARATFDHPPGFYGPPEGLLAVPMPLVARKRTHFVIYAPGE